MSSPEPSASLSPSPVSPISRWALDPAVMHLNHGSYGGCLRTTIAAATGFRERLEAAPMRFMVLEWQAELDRARARLAGFLHAPADRLAFLPSSTTGVAIALASAELAAGDDIVTIDQAYRACMNQLVRLAAARGATITVVSVPMPFDAQALIDGVAAAIRPRTRLALFDHITSPTALCLPIDALVALCRARGIQTVIDGAHAPGQIPLDVTAIGATWYIGNCHKWLCSPKGSGFLVAAEGAPARPVVTSHGASPEYGPPNRFHAELDWAGTHDPSTHLAVAAALDGVAAEGGGWPAIIARNHAVVCEMRRRLTDGLPGPLLAPDDALGSMAAVPIRLPAGTSPGALQDRVLRDGWEVPIVELPAGSRFPTLIRVSAHLYNRADEVDQLAAKLRSLGVTLGE